MQQSVNDTSSNYSYIWNSFLFEHTFENKMSKTSAVGVLLATCAFVATTRKGNCRCEEYSCVNSPYGMDVMGVVPVRRGMRCFRSRDSIGEVMYKSQADALVKLGLTKLGYTGIHMDDCWEQKTPKRDPKTNRLLPQCDSFPFWPQGFR